MTINSVQPSPAKRTALWSALREIYTFLWCPCTCPLSSTIPQGWQEDGGEIYNPTGAAAPLPSMVGKGNTHVIVAPASSYCVSDLAPRYTTPPNYSPFRYCKYWYDISLADVTWCMPMYHVILNHGNYEFLKTRKWSNSKCRLTTTWTILLLPTLPFRSVHRFFIT